MVKIVQQGVSMSENENLPPFVDREDLYKEVWFEPMVKVSARYGVSSSYLARVCRNLIIPTPPPGYWAKVAAGKAVRKAALPEISPDQSSQWIRDPSYISPETKPTHTSDTLRLTYSPMLPFVSRTHHILNGAKPLFLETRKNWTPERGLREDNVLLCPRKRNLPDIRATRKHLNSAMSFANAVYLLFEACDLRVSLNSTNVHLHLIHLDKADDFYDDGYRSIWAPGKETVVHMNGLAIGLCIYEAFEQRKVELVNNYYQPVKPTSSKRRKIVGSSSWTTTKSWPTGRFNLAIYSPYSETSWRKILSSLDMETDDSRRLVIDAVNTALEEIPLLVRERDEMRVKRDREWREMQRKWEEERIRAARESAKKEAKEEIEAAFEQWYSVKARVEFLDECEVEIGRLPHGADRDHLSEKLGAIRKLYKARSLLDTVRKWETPEERFKSK
ncbi:hypothetical protein [Marinimicrobium sp. ABcell2]|uniref:hypothetical protein n=1 Tax=Marinimicrobium sp. ABcell2 TaxID=3069751 RepID=UPI0027B69314|nr:hypothetical protein [Marinimicrobium sp. ABcell2]MDQ2077493.1 hypothetical protein [Marinimicrobium sp. ABcell2]